MVKFFAINPLNSLKIFDRSIKHGILYIRLSPNPKVNKLKNIAYILLGLLLSTSAQAQAPVPELRLPGDESIGGLDPLLDASKELDALEAKGTEKKDELLDKAIEEVFNEPAPAKTDTAAAPAASGKATIEIDLDVPPLPVAEDAAPLEEEIAEPIKAVEKDPKVEVMPTNRELEAAKEAEKSAAPAAIQEKIVVEEKKEAPAQPAEEVVIEVKEEAVKPVEEVKKEVKKPVAAAATKQPAKKVVLPSQTPKSLRQNYTSAVPDELGYDPFSITPRHFKAADPSLPAGIYLLNDGNAATQQNFVPVNAVAPVTPVAPVVPVTPVTPVPVKKVPASLAPRQFQINDATPSAIPLPAAKLPESMKQVSLEEDELDMIQVFPSKQEKLSVKSDIVIERADFSNPFGSAVAPESLDALTTTEYNGDDSSMIDFSENEAGDMDITTPAPAVAGNFYMQDSGLEVSVRDAPESSLSVMKNAHEALQAGQYESAAKYYQEALNANQNNKKALFGLATAYHMNKQYDDARGAYLKLIKLAPDYWPAVNNYIILVTEENPERSIARLEDLFARNPSFAAIPAQLGNLYYGKGQTKKAVDFYTAALKIEPRNIDYRYNLAIILEKAGENVQAAALYRSLLDDAMKGATLPENPTSIRDRYFEIVSG